jgi:hypothetical protein
MSRFEKSPQIAQILGKHPTANGVFWCNWRASKANKINENRSVRTGQSELANRRQDFALPNFNQRMRKQLRGTTERELEPSA